MKIFEKEDVRVNFVDENNVFVGYNLMQDCCECADWFISNKIENEILDTKDLKIKDYIFDKTFFEELENCPTLDEGRMIIFKLVCTGKPDLYLHLFNSHNGYYSHGFEFGIGEDILKEGSL